MALSGLSVGRIGGCFSLAGERVLNTILPLSGNGAEHQGSTKNISRWGKGFDWCGHKPLLFSIGTAIATVRIA